MRTYSRTAGIWAAGVRSAAVAWAVARIAAELIDAQRLGSVHDSGSYSSRAMQHWYRAYRRLADYLHCRQ